MEQQKKSSFSGSIGFVLAAAGSAVGLGNIWRFPNLAAKHGGGLFILVYIALVLLFGFALLMTDIAIGRKTGMNAGNAYGAIHKKWKWVGHLTFVVPAIIMTYYTVIGGWILKYFTEYVTFNGAQVASDGYFGNFTSSTVAPVVFMLIYLAITAIIVYAGVEKGIEKFSKIVMPCLLILIAGIAIYSLTLSYTTESGEIRTGLQGVAVYLVPNFDGLTVGKFFNIMLDAMNQMFYSLSVAMGIMITYGSYVKKDININKSVTQIQIFDTMVAILSGMMIVPAVCVFFGPERMVNEAGAGLMFVTLPKVFEVMPGGTVIGAIFFLMVILAALTSSISLMETIVSIFMAKFKLGRRVSCGIVLGISVLIGIPASIGYSAWSGVTILGMQFLDFFDFLSNNIIMPIVALLTCILIGYVAKTTYIEEEVELNAPFKSKGLFRVMIKYVAPVFMVVIFLSSIFGYV